MWIDTLVLFLQELYEWLPTPAMIYLGIYCICYWVLVYDGTVLEISILISLKDMQPLNPRNNKIKQADFISFSTSGVEVGIGCKMRASLCSIRCCFWLLNPHLIEEVCVECNLWRINDSSTVTWDQSMCVLRQCSKEKIRESLR